MFSMFASGFTAAGAISIAMNGHWVPASVLAVLSVINFACALAGR